MTLVYVSDVDEDDSATVAAAAAAADDDDDDDDGSAEDDTMPIFKTIIMMNITFLTMMTMLL